MGTLERDVAVLKHDRDKSSSLVPESAAQYRHTYRTLLDETGAPLSVQQRLMRHADARMTLKYGVTLDDSKRNANKKVVRLVLVGKKAAQLGTGPFCSLAVSPKPRQYCGKMASPAGFEMLGGVIRLF